MIRERRLGRGLGALLGGPNIALGLESPSDSVESPSDSVESPSDSVDGSGLIRISVYEIDTNPYQPRTEFDETDIEALSDSIKAHGLLQPIVVRREGERFQLISGERRWRAAIRAGWDQVPAMVRDAGDQEVAELTIVENLQRKDLGPLEKAVSFKRYLEQFGCTQEELAKRLSVDRSTVANLIRLLELPDAVQEALREKKITAGHARALLPLGEEREQVDACKRIQRESLSVRATEEFVSETLKDDDVLRVVGLDDDRPSSQSPKSDQLAALEQELRAALGTRVELKQTAKGRGRITVHFTSHEEFVRLRHHLCGTKMVEHRAAG